MSNDKSAKMLERVRALLAKADSTNFPEEAETFRAKANELMTNYAIEQWMVDEAQAGVGARPKPEVRYVSIDWWYDSDREIAGSMFSLFRGVYRHCRCVVADRGRGSSGNYREQPVIGLASDLDYADLMFTHLLLQMSKALDPKPNPVMTVAENGYKLRSSGLDWMVATRRMWDAGLLDVPRGKAGVIERYDFQAGEYVVNHITKEMRWPELPENTRQVLKNRLAQITRNHRRANGLEDYTHTTPRIYRRSFAPGFVQEVRARFREMDTKYAEDHKSSGMEVALRDIHSMAVELYKEKWPEPEPDPDAKPARVSKAVGREVRFSGQAYSRGADAGRKAEIAVNPSKRVAPRKTLPGA